MMELYQLKKVKEMIKNKKPMFEGAGRIVFDLEDGHIVKVAKNERGTIEIENEWYVYNHVPSHIQTKLCPIVWYEKGYLIMPKIKVYGRGLNFNHCPTLFADKNKELVNYLVKEFDLDDFDFTFEFNWGLYNGNLVLLDYGKTYFGEKVKLSNFKEVY